MPTSSHRKRRRGAGLSIDALEVGAQESENVVVKSFVQAAKEFRLMLTRESLRKEDWDEITDVIRSTVWDIQDYLGLSPDEEREEKVGAREVLKFDAETMTSPMEPHQEILKVDANTMTSPVEPRQQTFSNAESDSEWYDSIWGCSKPPRKVRRCRRRRVCHEQSTSGSVNVALQEEHNQLLKNIESALGRISEVAMEFMRVTRCTKSGPFEGNGVQSFDDHIKNFDDCSRNKAGHEPNHGLMESKDHLCRIMQPVSGDYYQRGNKWAHFCRVNKKEGETLCDY